MKFRDGKDKEFHSAVKARARTYFEARGISPSGGWRAVAKGSGFVALSVGLYALILSNRLNGPSLLVVAGLFGVSCILVSFNLAHDAAHDSLTQNRSFNRLVYVVTFLWNGTSPYLWKRRHIGSHHTFPNVEGGDADMDENPFLRVTPSSPHRWYFRYQHLYAPLIYMLFSIYSVFLYDFQFFFRDRLANMDLRQEIRRRRVFAIVALEKLAYFGLMLVIPLLVLDQPWWGVVLGFVVMQCAASLAFTIPLVSTHIAEGITFPEVDAAGQVEGSWASHQLATSMDYSPDSRLANWFLGAVNAHAAHHLFPEVCHVHYIALSAIIQQTAREHRVRYNAMPFSEAIQSHFRHLKKMGRSPGTIGGTWRKYRSENPTEYLASTDEVGPSQAIVVFGSRLVAQAVEDGGGEVFRADPAFLGLGSNLVGRAVDLTPFDASTSQGDREDAAPVVAAGVAVEARASTELGHADDQGLFE
jgi:linoleoyl-CoA desaturase